MLKRDSRLPPGPRWSPLGQLLPLRRDMIGFLADAKRQYGDYAFFNIGHLKCCLISEPEGVRTVLVTNQKNFVKGRPLELARELLGEGLLTAEGEHHLRHRRMIQPLLYRSRLPGYADAMVESAAAIDRRWQDGQTRDIMVDMSDLALVISGKTMFGADVSEEVREISTSLTAAMRLFTRVTVPFSEYLIRLPLPSSVSFYRARARLDKTIYRLIHERQKLGTDGGDLLSLLLGLSNGDQSRLPDPEIRDEALI
ncbi:MAG TPA: cytochrome P450, partial [Longimicrobium sp.]